jgi:hypothetical protein
MVLCDWMTVVVTTGRQYGGEGVGGWEWEQQVRQLQVVGGIVGGWDRPLSWIDAPVRPSGVE